jgi:hypothetical protein
MDWFMYGLDIRNLTSSMRYNALVLPRLWDTIIYAEVLQFLAVWLLQNL